MNETALGRGEYVIPAAYIDRPLERYAAAEKRSLLPERNQRIDSRCPAGRHIRRHQRHEPEQNRNYYIRQWIGGRDPKELAAQHPRRAEAHGYPDSQTRKDEPRSHPHHEREHVPSWRPEGHPHSQFLRPTRGME
jgi:hypothetical protein